MDTPITQATAHRNNIVAVYSDRVEIRSGWQGQNSESLHIRDIANVNIRGVINCTLTLESNEGQLYRLDRMALPDARGIKNAIERQKRKAGLYE